MSDIPLLAGCAAVQQRETDISKSREAIVLMIDAVKAAALDCGNEKILQHVKKIYVPRGTWSYSDPARLIADAIGATQAKTVLADFGILQQTLIGDACERIATGEIDCAIVAGGEAKFRQLQASIQQVAAPETAQETKPDVLMEPSADLYLDAEMQAGLMMPVGFYAIIESALRFARGESIADSRDRIAKRYQRFSEIAANNPQAWKQEKMLADNIRNAVGKNRMLAFPYTKAHNSEWNVDQASALILCSAKLADQLGIAQEKRVYPLVSSESNHMLCLSQREHLHRASGTDLALQAALKQTGLDKNDFSVLDLYSCFPAAVQVYADALGFSASGIEDDRDLTVTGGMASAGGPLNNYVLQALCRLVEKLRESAAEKNQVTNGLITSVSGMITKQAFGLWSTAKPQQPFAFIDVSDEVEAVSCTVPVLDNYQGAATIAGYTVLYNGDVPVRAIAIADTVNGERVVVFSEEPELLLRFVGDEEMCGKKITVEGNLFSLMPLKAS
jgi:acetyl-CoA C-acetyltransferase